MTRNDIKREVLPIPDQQYQGLITFDAKDPSSKFPDIEPVRPPAGAPNVLRIDVGIPVTGERETKGVVFRIYSELFGILDRRAWPTQIQRSRWYGIDPDMSTRPNNPLAGN